MGIDTWDDLRVLLAVHRAGSLLGAGRRLGLSTSTTGRRLDALEASVGVRLVNRSRAGTELEPAALRLVGLAEALEHGLEAEQRDRRSVAGTLKVSVPDGFVVDVTAALLGFRRDHPDIDIELIGESRMADVARREADIAVRITRSTSSLLIEKHLATLRFGLFASADYLRRFLPSRRLARSEAGRHAFIGLDPRWKGLPHEQWMTSLGARRFPFRSTSVAAILAAVQQGVGLAALLEQVGRSAGLVRVDVEAAGPTQALYLVYHRELRNVPHVRAAIAAIEAHVRANR